jgi:hypothetical protein
MRFYKDVAPDGAGSHVIFSGQTFYGAQIPNCETRKTHARPARKTGDDDTAKMNVKSALDRNLNAKHTHNHGKNRAAQCGRIII